MICAFFSHTDTSKSVTTNNSHNQRTNLTPERTNNKRIHVPIWSLGSHFSLLLSFPVQPTFSSFSHLITLTLYPLFCFCFFPKPLFNLLSSFLLHPVVIKAMSFCGHSCLGPIYQTADLPSLVLPLSLPPSLSFSLSLSPSLSPSLFLLSFLILSSIV